MGRLIDADALDKEMYHKSFEVDDGRNVWNSGLWIRYKIYEEAVRDAPTVDAIPVAYIESEKQRVNAMVVEEAKAGNIKEADRLSTIMAVMDALISNWRYTTGNDWRAENETD